MNTTLFNKVDLIVVPIVLALLTFIFNLIKKKQPRELQMFFFKAFYLRVLGSLAITTVYQYIFGYGDTFGYYHIIQVISSFFSNDVVSWANIIWHNTDGDNTHILKCVEVLESGDNPITAVIFVIPENVFICKIASIFNIICFNSYLGMALFFGALSFLGCWYMFKTFVHIFPGYQKQFAWFCLYLPSLWFWGNGVLKDPVCIFALGLLFYYFFVKQRSFLKRIVIISIAVFILLQIKSYIFYAFLIAAALGLIITYFRNFNIIGKIVSLIFVSLLLVLLYPVLAEFINKSFEDIASQSKFFIDQYSQNSTEGDSTIIPVFDPSIFGLIKLSVRGLVTVFLRPFPWEVNKILYVFLILENILLYVVVFKKIKIGPVEFKKNHKYVANFCILFFIFLGIMIGVTTFNLGTIARYRVPTLPFLFAGVFSLKLVFKKRRLDKLYNINL